MRARRRDEQFDSLIRCFYPNLKKFEADEERTIEEANKATMTSASETATRGQQRARQKVRDGAGEACLDFPFCPKDTERVKRLCQSTERYDLVH